MRKYCTMLFMLLLSQFTYSRENGLISYVKSTIIEDTIQSRFLVQEKNYVYSIPNNSNSHSPIIITLDGHYQFYSVLGGVLFESDILLSSDIPPSIVVGIGSNNRYDEYVGARSDSFRNFLFFELVPEVRRLTKSSGPIILIGHSHGAEFAFNSLIQKDLDLNAVLLVSPIIRDITDQAFLKSVKDSTEQGMVIVASYSSINDVPSRLKSIHQIDSLFEGYINYSSRVFDFGDHGSLFLHSVPHGLVEIFGIMQKWNNFELEQSQDAAGYLEELVRTKEESFRFYFLPDESILESFAVIGENNPEKAVSLLEWLESRIKQDNANDRYSLYLAFALYLKAGYLIDLNHELRALKCYEELIPLLTDEITNKDEIIKEYKDLKVKTKNK
jgi:hypothetical protein